jgi:hypothetical protein
MSNTGCRNDALVNLLNGLGYQPVLMQGSNRLPPEMYVFREGNGQLIRRGALSDYLAPNCMIPELVSGTLFDKLTHKETSRKGLEAAATFLGDALACIGITSAPKLNLSFAPRSEFTFSFDDATYKSLDPSKIDHMLKDLNTGAIPIEDIKNGYLHIAYEYAYAGAITMRIKRDTDIALGLKVLQIGQYIDLGAKGEIHVTDDTTIIFASKKQEPAVFAYKVGRLTRRGDRWEFHPGEEIGAFFAPNEEVKKPYILERGVVLRVEES